MHLHFSLCAPRYYDIVPVFSRTFERLRGAAILVQHRVHSPSRQSQQPVPRRRKRQNPNQTSPPPQSLHPFFHTSAPCLTLVTCWPNTRYAASSSRGNAMVASAATSSHLRDHQRRASRVAGGFSTTAFHLLGMTFHQAPPTATGRRSCHECNFAPVSTDGE